MNNNRNMSDDVLVKHLLGEANAAEQQEVQEWIAASPENRKYYDHFRVIWEQSKNLQPTHTVDTNDAWNRFMQRVDREDIINTVPEAVARRIPFWNPRMLARAAAMLVMMVGAGWLIYTATDNGDMMTVASVEKVLKHTLPDGTTVTLNKNSTISYAGHFDGEKRSVTLSGEAFFDVTPNKSRPFVIDAGNSSVTVVGTTFNVKSRKDITEVIVESGVVEVAKKQYFVRLKPGERAMVLPDKEAPVALRTTDSLYNYYRTNEFICDGIPLSKLMNTLSEVYEVQIEIKDPRLATLPINTVLSTNNLDEILDVISRTFREQLTIERKGNIIIIRSAQ